MNKSTNLILILVLCTSVLIGQKINNLNDPHLVIAEDATPHNHSQCITDAQRAEINRRIAKNIIEYKIELKNEKSLITLFDWPIEQNSAFDYNSTFALWQYVDHDPAFPNQLEDYNCGDYTYDTPGGYNHKGIDIGLWPFMWNQVYNDQTHVIAAAAGTIVDKHDGEPHLNCVNSNVPANYVVLQHTDGTESLYLHMKNGSVTTKSIGASVVTGEYLGIVASSGNSSGPHLHFEVTDANTDLIDPYAGPCNNMNTSSYWNNQKPYWEPTINVLLTHDAVPSLGNCPSSETTNLQNNFTGGDLVYFASYLHDQLSTNSLSYEIIQPNGTVWQSWVNSSPSDYRSPYYIWNYTLPTSAMPGTWKWEGTLNGQTVSHDFYVTGPMLPNLTCSNSGSLSITNTLNVSGVQVINDGTAASASSTLGYYLSTNTNFTTSDYLAGTDFVSALGINQTSAESTTISSSNILNMPPDGNYYLGMIVDYSDIVTESDETDNNDCFYTSPQVIVGCTNASAHNYNSSANFDNNACLTCNDGTQNGDESGVDCGGSICAPCPIDLVATNCGAYSKSGSTLTINGVMITNQGTGNSTASTLGYYLSTDTNINTADYLIGTDYVSPLSGGQSSTESITVDIALISPPIPAGTYYVGMIADYTNAVAESNEANNNDCFFSSFTVIYDCKNATAHNYNPAATYDDNSCETCTDGILNGDETDIDCGGTLCNPCTNCNVTINTYPAVSEFQGSIGNWIQSSSDMIDWTIISGPTPSSGTGTSNTYSMSDYIYLEASSNTNSFGILNSSCYDLSSLSSPELSFAYNMEGAGMGSLVILISDDNGSTWTVKFNKSGNQGIGWHKEVIDLSEFIGETIQISIEGTTGTTYQSDIGIDQFIIKDKCSSSCTNTISTYNYNNFFDANIGDFEQISGCDDINWSYNSGPTSSQNTGPTSGYLNSNGYMYVESSSPNHPFKMAIIESPCFNTSSLNLPAIYMTYHMYGAEMGFLELEISDDNGQSWEQLFTRNGDQTDTWLGYFNEGLNAYNNTVKFRITAITGDWFTSDLAFDYFWIYERCPNSYFFSSAQNFSSIYEADVFIQSSSIITAPYMEYDAGQFIELIPGFEVQSGTEFNAFIDGCGDNGNELAVPEDNSSSLKNINQPNQSNNR